MSIGSSSGFVWISNRRSSGTSFAIDCSPETFAIGCGIATPAAAQIDDVADERVVRVMTRNVYHGVDAEIFDVGNATSTPDLLAKVAAVYQGYIARNFPERAAALAAEIDAERPDLIGLQEAIIVRTQSPADGPATAATTVALDYVQLLLDALAARGLAYEIVVQSINFDIELPSALGMDVRHTVRDVILAPSFPRISDLKLSNAQAAHFAVNCVLPTNLGPITVRRGWVAVDAKTRGQSFRFVNTHLDGDCFPVTAAIQQAQAAEVLAGPGATGLPLIIVGDLNSPADGTGTTYNALMSAGLFDAWMLAGSGPGLSCCQADDLLNPTSLLDRRIDVVLFRGGFTALQAHIVGDNPADRTPSGLWPSDHAGFAAALVVPIH
jgi:endonuclease/exonuclease/phosphatase family metal-dependent hydrolase